MLNKALLFLSLLLISACQPNLPRTVPTKVNEVQGTKAERIKAVTKIIATQEPLPSSLLDAYFLEKKIGDGQLGPSDFVSFAMLEVKPTDIPAWQSKLSPLTTQPQFSAPPSPQDWWVSEANHSSLTFYELSPYTSRLHGWIGIDTKTSKIYIYTFTT